MRCLCLSLLFLCPAAVAQSYEVSMFAVMSSQVADISGEVVGRMFQAEIQSSANEILNKRLNEFRRAQHQIDQLTELLREAKARARLDVRYQSPQSTCCFGAFTSWRRYCWRFHSLFRFYRSCS